ncbi:MAG TPA: hypothetical protein VKU41_06470 [Polyangiaceae bacterium]|nr:hypothetical protein [Polyangiaceae bacterium]
MTSFSFAALAVSGAALVGIDTGCSSGSSHSGPACNPCDDGAAPSNGGQALSGHDTNSYGVAYPNPSTGYGRSPRSGHTPGSVIQNFKFLGYPNADTSQGLQTIALADYYDPCNTNYAMIHLTVAAVWCPPCNQETDDIVAAKGAIAAKRVVVIQALSDGATQGVDATPSDLISWMKTHHSNFTEMLDPGLRNLGGFFNAAAIPWNCDIDPRTMEMVKAGVGYEADVTSGLSSIPSTPSYPVPAVCGDQ